MELVSLYEEEERSELSDKQRGNSKKVTICKQEKSINHSEPYQPAAWSWTFQTPELWEVIVIA